MAPEPPEWVYNRAESGADRWMPLDPSKSAIYVEPSRTATAALVEAPTPDLLGAVRSEVGDAAADAIEDGSLDDDELTELLLRRASPRERVGMALEVSGGADAIDIDVKADWAYEEGPHGADRWVNDSGDVRYREPAGAGVDLTEEELDEARELADCHGERGGAHDACSNVFADELEHLGGGDDRAAYRTSSGDVLKIGKGVERGLPGAHGDEVNEKAAESWERVRGTEAEDRVLPVIDHADDYSWIAQPEAEFDVSEAEADEARDAIREAGFAPLDSSAKNFARHDGDVVLADLGDGIYEADGADAKADWAYEEGPTGADRWVSDSGEVRYRRPAGADDGVDVDPNDLEIGDRITLDRGDGPESGKFMGTAGLSGDKLAVQLGPGGIANIPLEDIEGLDVDEVTSHSERAEPDPPESRLDDGPDPVGLPGSDEDDPRELRARRDAALDQLRPAYSDDAVDEVANTLDRWNRGGYTSSNTGGVWAAARAMNGGTVPERVAPGSESVSEETTAAMADFMRICRESVRAEHGDSVETYRAVSSDVLEEYGEVTEDGVRVMPQALESWTRQRDIAEDYVDPGDVVLKREMDVDGVGFASGLALGAAHPGLDEITAAEGVPYVVPEDQIERPAEAAKASDGGEGLRPLPAGETDWMHDDEPVDAKADWSYEEGPTGADRWVSDSGDVRYRRPAGAEPAPDDEPGEGTIAASDLSEGDEVLIDGDVCEVSTLEDMGGGFYIAGRDDSGEVHTARVGPDEPFDRPGAGGLDPGDVADLAVEGLDDDAAEIVRAYGSHYDTEDEITLEVENPDPEAFDDEMAARRALDALGGALGMDPGLESEGVEKLAREAGSEDPSEVARVWGEGWDETEEGRGVLDETDVDAEAFARMVGDKEEELSGLADTTAAAGLVIEDLKEREESEVGRENLDHWETVEPIDQMYGEYEGRDLILHDGTRVRVSDYFNASGDMAIAEVNDDGGYDWADRERTSWDELKHDVEGVVDETPDPDDLNDEERLSAANIAARGALSGAGGNVESDWKKYGEVLDLMDDEELETALYDAVTNVPDEGVGGVAKGDAPLQAVMGEKYNGGDGDMALDTMADPDDIAVLTSRMDPDSLVDAVERIFDDLDAAAAGELGAESHAFNADVADAAKAEKAALYNAAVAFAPDESVREELPERVDPPTSGYIGGTDAATDMTTAEGYEDFKSAWIQGWYPSSDTAGATLTGIALENFKANGDSDAFAWTYGRPIGDVDTEQIEEHFETMHQKTQERLDGEQKLHRGVKGAVTTHSSLESWTTRKDIADKFDDHVMTAEVDPGDVLATWETLGDDWPEEDVKGKKEWMVLGGAF